MVVVDMALEPTRDDAGVPAVMAAVLPAGFGYVVTAHRAIEAPEPASAS